MVAMGIREFEPSDYPSVALIHDSLFPNHLFFRKRDEYEDSCYGRTRYRMKRLVAEVGSGGVVGFGEYKHLFFAYHRRKFAINIEVSPEWQRRGIGGTLYNQIMKELVGLGAETVWPLVLSTSSSAIEFLQKRGFVQKRKMIESRLDLEKFDPAPFSAALDRLKAEGLAISSFSSAMHEDPSSARKLKDLDDSGSADVPSVLVESPMDFHDYEIIILNSPIMVWDGSFVAKERGDFVGASSLLESGASAMLDQGFTVVNPAWRGRGIAQAVKVHVAMYAKNKGFRYIRTHNDSENAPMLAVNKKLGFARGADFLTFERTI
jgi:ribosomal protein S18 acetylase RimI-like enzyme